MEGYVIRLFIDCVKTVNILRIGGKLILERFVEIGVVAHNFHTQIICGNCHKSAYCAQSHNTESFSENFRTRKLGFTFFNEFTYILALAFKGFAPVISGGDPT